MNTHGLRLGHRSLAAEPWRLHAIRISLVLLFIALKNAKDFAVFFK
jgi:hypothetical protein